MALADRLTSSSTLVICSESAALLSLTAGTVRDERAGRGRGHGREGGHGHGRGREHGHTFDGSLTSVLARAGFAGWPPARRPHRLAPLIERQRRSTAGTSSQHERRRHEGGGRADLHAHGAVWLLWHGGCHRLPSSRRGPCPGTEHHRQAVPRGPRWHPHTRQGRHPAD